MHFLRQIHSSCMRDWSRTKSAPPSMARPRNSESGKKDNDNSTTSTIASPEGIQRMLVEHSGKDWLQQMNKEAEYHYMRKLTEIQPTTTNGNCKFKLFDLLYKKEEVRNYTANKLRRDSSAASEKMKKHKRPTMMKELSEGVRFEREFCCEKHARRLRKW